MLRFSNFYIGFEDVSKFDRMLDMLDLSKAKTILTASSKKENLFN